MDDLIRGGQVSFHKIRMLCQVSKLFAHVSIFLIIISIGYSYYKNIAIEEWKLGWVWLKADINVDNDDYKVTYKSKYGITKTVEAKAFVSDLYVVNTIKKFKVALYKGLSIAAIMLGVIIGSLIAFFWLKGRGIKRNKNLRGIFILDTKELKSELQKHNKLTKEYIPFTLADFTYPLTGRKDSWSAGEQSHTMLIGSTGAGKTKIIQNLVYQLHKRNQKAIIVDVKGDYIEHFYRETRGDIILNPLDKRGKNWSIFKETNPLKGFATIAKSLLPKESKSDPIWIDAARGVFAELANLYVSENLSMAEFADKLLKTDLKLLNKLLDKTGAARIINPDIEKAALSVLMVLSTYLKPLKLYQSSKDVFSITDWVNDNTQNNFLFIASKADVKEDINPLITTQVDIAVNALRSLKTQSNTPKIWFILDEIPYFDQPIPSLKDGLAMARSYGGCFVLGTQDMSSLSKIYSEETARSIANNCKTKIYMNIAGKETAYWCSQSLGEGEIEEWHEGLSYGAHEMRDGIQVNRNKIIRSVVLPSELMMLKAGEGFIQFAGFKPAKFKFEDQNFKRIAEGYLENNDLLKLFATELEMGEKRRKEIEIKLLKTEGNESEKVIKMKSYKQKELENIELTTKEISREEIKKEDISMMNV